jgi:hypothetical protein
VKVLHLPVNIASQISVTVKALQEAGIQARGFVVSDSLIQSKESVELQIIDLRNRFTKFTSYVRIMPKVIRYIQWADIIHWHFGETALPRYLDLFWAKMWCKPGIVEFWGSDIRIAEIEAKDNPYYSEVYKKKEYPYSDSYDNSWKRQSVFVRAGCEFLIACHSLEPYIFPEFMPKVHFVRQRINSEDFEPSYPDPGRHHPLVVHSPSNPMVKGTSAILSTVHALRAEINFNFHLITGMDHNRALRAISEADIFIDQLILGGHGLAALEAMALGKPVICYIKPSMVDHYPDDLPIVNANMHNLPEILSELLNDPQRRYQLGCMGRRYVEKYHNANMLTNELIDIYKGILIKKRGPIGHL